MTAFSWGSTTVVPVTASAGPNAVVVKVQGANDLDPFIELSLEDAGAPNVDRMTPDEAWQLARSLERAALAAWNPPTMVRGKVRWAR
jgi:hypothetical protein